MKKILVILLSYLMVITNSAAEKVIWVHESPMFFKHLHDDVEVSLMFDTTRYIFNQMKSEITDFRIIPYARFANDMKNNKQQTLCTPGVIKKPDREVYGYFSQPIQLFPTIRILFSKKYFPLKPELLDEDGKLISLKALFEQYPHALLTLASERSYGSFIDQEIKKLDKKNIHEVKGIHKYSAFVNMLSKNRIDFLVIYPTRYALLVKEEENIANIYSIAIKGNSKYVMPRIMCSKTALGKQTIEKIDKILDKIYDGDKFYQLHTKYLSNDMKKEFKTDFDQFLRKRNF